MKNFKFHMPPNFPLTLLLTIASLVLPAKVSGVLAKDKMTPEEIVTKHLDSIGSLQARTSIKSRIITGTSTAVFRGQGSGTSNGNAVLASEETKSMIGMKFGSVRYPHELMGFNGKNLTVGYITPGVRSTLGQFLLQNEAIFKEGLAGGILSSAWPLLSKEGRGAKLEYAGTENSGGRNLYKIAYLPRKGSELRITLFFDAESFRHVRTQYERTIGARMGSGGVDSSASQRETRYRMVEEFSDFKAESGLTLPHTYKLQLFWDATSGTILYDWTLNLQQFTFNQPIDARGFVVSSI